MLLNAFGIMREEQKSYIPENEQQKVIRVARVWFPIYAARSAVDPSWVLSCR